MKFRDLIYSIPVNLQFSNFLKEIYLRILIETSQNRKQSPKGRTIRKVMWGGGGDFRAAGFFFRYQIPCMNFSSAAA